MSWKCTRCETLNRDDLQSCEVCGRARPPLGAEPPRRPPPAGGPAGRSETSAGRGRVCRCGRVFAGPREWLCPECGQPQFGFAACPACGKKTYGGAPYCRHCGRSLALPGVRI